MEIFTDFTGSGFLVFYMVMLATCVLAGMWIPAVLRPEGRGRAPDDPEQLALLAGGEERHANAVLSSLFARNAIDQGGRGQLTVVRSEAGETEAERSILRKVGPFLVAEARITLKHHADRIRDDLTARGLLMDSGERWRLRTVSILPYLALLVLGIYRQQAGAAQGEPTGFLIALLGLTVVIAMFRFGMLNPRTVAGNAAIESLQSHSSRMKRAPRPAEAGYVVALYGTAVLVGTPWEPLHAAQRRSDDTGGSGADGDGDGGGGGCGGGCGGCGG